MVSLLTSVQVSRQSCTKEGKWETAPHLAGLIHFGQDFAQLSGKAHFKEAVSFIKDAVLHSAQAHALYLLQVVHQPPCKANNRSQSSGASAAFKTIGVRLVVHQPSYETTRLQVVHQPLCKTTEVKHGCHGALLC